jgi:hypothetical protein
MPHHARCVAHSWIGIDAVRYDMFSLRQSMNLHTNNKFITAHHVNSQFCCDASVLVNRFLIIITPLFIHCGCLPVSISLGIQVLPH